MIKRMLPKSLLFCSILAVAASSLNAAGNEIPDVPREFRAAWVATVSNIDWPSSRNLSTEVQKAELIEILDTAVDINLNAIIFQIRPMFDALYPSELEPWSEFLTGTMGKAPDPYYDPLQFVIEESHNRGLELHVWFNPYRARHTSARSEISENHVSKTHPEIVREYGKFLWADPAEEDTKRLTLDVILDVVRRYDIDGVHIDDYFYPYKSYGDGAEFPDDGPWKRYQEEGGKLSRNDWRRHHVNDFVERFYKEVKKEDPLVKVGISPFGIWRPGHPEGIEGLDQYEHLYADAKLWLNEGWVDYYTPQLYWPMEREKQSYVRLLEWWVEQNHQDRHVWPGNFVNGIRDETGSRSPQEILNQIDATRKQPGATGNVFFSVKAFTQDLQKVNEKLIGGPYADQALVPASPWLAKGTPPQPSLRSKLNPKTGENVISWSAGSSDPVQLWVVYRKEDGQWSHQIIPANGKTTATLDLKPDHQVTEIAVSAVDRAGNESPRAWRSIR